MRVINVVGAAILLAAAATGPIGTAAASTDNAERCERYAMEDEIPMEDKAQYIEDCLAELSEIGKREDAGDGGESDEPQESPSD